MQREWGGPVAMDLWAPSRVGDAETERQWAHLLRTGTSPKSAAALIELYTDLDVRHALPLVSAPTLILHRAEDRAVRPELGRYIAEHINGARHVEVPGADHVLWTQGVAAILDEIEEFLTGTRQARPPERVLATVLFTDIVDSTGHLARLGDHRWKEVLDRHDDAVSRAVERFQGRVVQTTGDGVLATFDGPARAIQCATSINAEVDGLGLQIRAGLHAGECELRGDNVGGMAVHIAARVMARAAASEVLVSSTVKDLVVGSGIEFDDRGEAELKGVPDEWHLYAVRTGT
jgi:class 3 adenylate cyclase